METENFKLEIKINRKQVEQKKKKEELTYTALLCKLSE